MTGELPLGCDTLVATGSATADGSVLFAKNSDRHPDECQHLRTYPAAEWAEGAALRCQYLSIPQARRTLAMLGSQPFWLWGFEHGVNERGVAIGNEAIWTRAPRAATGLLGMDLLRLGLERGETAQESLEVITRLLEAHGQGGSPRHDNPAAEGYDNSFIIADPREAWVLETSGREWVARRVEGIYSISNVPSIRAEWDAASAALRDRPGLDFARDLGDYETSPRTGAKARCARSRGLLQEKAGRLREEDMMAFLRDHGADPGWRPGASDGPTICLHAPGGRTAASMVVSLRPEGLTAWCALGTPCLAPFLPFYVDVPVPAALGRGTAEFSEDSLWWQRRRGADRLEEDWSARSPASRARWATWETELLREAPAFAQAPRERRAAWAAENVKALASLL